MRWQTSAPTSATRPVPPAPPTPSTRRGFLVGGTLLAGGTILAACSRGDASPDAPVSSESASARVAGSADPVLDQAIATELALIDAYDRALANGSDRLLASIREEHLAHLAALGGTMPVTPSEENSSGAAPVDRADLIALEAGAALAGRDACRDAVDRELVRTLAFIAASEASHGPALEAAR